MKDENGTSSYGKIYRMVILCHDSIWTLAAKFWCGDKREVYELPYSNWFGDFFLCSDHNIAAIFQVIGVQ
jgi:hypothetical protein